jgi:hypothetical protein
MVGTMSSWACESGTRHSRDWSATPGHTFTLPVQFSINSAAIGSPAMAGLHRQDHQAVCVPVPTVGKQHADAGKWWGGYPKTCLRAITPMLP